MRAIGGRESGISHSPSLRTGQATLRIRLSGWWSPRRGLTGRLTGRPEKQPWPVAETPAVGLLALFGRRVVNMASKRISGQMPVALARSVPVCVALRHRRRCCLRRSLHSSSTFLHSLRSRPITVLLRCRVGGGALKRRPPSAANLHVRFSRMQVSPRHPLRKRKLGVRNQVVSLCVRQVGRGDQ